MPDRVRYSVVVPVYNEEAVVAQTYRRLKAVMEGIGEPYELLFVNDGSGDRTGAILQYCAEMDSRVKLIDFSRNFGHQIAITAGMDYAEGAAVVVIDADLQDPPELIPDMIAKWRQGYEVVYARRTSRQGETWFKKQSAKLYYRLLRASTDIEIPVDTGDFRLLDRKVIEELKRMPERNRYVRGLVSWVGFSQTAVDYARQERAGGISKYPLRKMLKLFLDGMTSFSTKPIKLASVGGSALAGAGLAYGIVAAAVGLAGADVAALHYFAALQLLLAGVVLIALGLVGEYVARIFDEARGRPLYIVRACYGMRKQDFKAGRIG
ncbi:glycosyltransferase family 2 protein [Cohnella zeiphila]|uniref:Glycosyltransferase family 2 protein n=1 Tax=Cohnella zeiphila TaxID=2761120 RepID=A0A7X0VTN0_9BACL|nr:glycosyltransferase family 2 protein [Cohnella zeiphila]MBB6729535.1 glycosyltransferase family 2 protein [Cohnella zeiphila]